MALFLSRWPQLNRDPGCARGPKNSVLHVRRAARAGRNRASMLPGTCGVGRTAALSAPVCIARLTALPVGSPTL